MHLSGAAKPHHQVQQHRVVLGYSHLGMLAAARWMMKQITPALRDAMKARAGWKLRIVGESALANDSQRVQQHKFRQICAFAKHLQCNLLLTNLF